MDAQLLVAQQLVAQQLVQRRVGGRGERRTVMAAPADHTRARRRLGVAGRVFALDVLLVAVGVGLALTGVLAGGPLAAAPLTLPWWAIAVATYLSGRAVVHLHLRSDAHTVSLGEIPIALGLFFASPVGLLAGQLIGDALALAHGRQRPMKFAFNLIQYTFSTVVAIATFRLLAGDPATADTPILLCALFALLTGSLVGVLAVQAAIFASVGGLDLRDLGEGVAFGLSATAATGCLALVGVALLWVDPGAGWLLGVPALTLWAAYSAYTRLRRQHGRLRQLFRTTQVMHEAPDVETSLLGLLSQAREILRAEHAAVVFPLPSRRAALQTSVGANAAGPVMREVPFEHGARPWSAIAADEACMLVREPGALGVLDRHLGVGSLNEALIAPLRGDSHTIGYLLVAGRRSNVQPYDEADRGLMATMANLASGALERGRLQQRMRELADAEEQLRHEVAHDPLTGLANRRQLLDRLEAAMSVRTPEARPAVLYLDLDRFKDVNDSIGHHAGDALLTTVADCLREALRGQDTAARLGGDEFAVVLPAVATVDEALTVVRRILGELDRPLVLDGVALRAKISIGIALAGDDHDADDLLRDADAAMYEAKQAGGAGYSVAGSGAGPVVGDAASASLRLIA